MSATKCSKMHPTMQLYKITSESEVVIPDSWGCHQSNEMITLKFKRN